MLCGVNRVVYFLLSANSNILTQTLFSTNLDTLLSTSSKCSNLPYHSEHEQMFCSREISHEDEQHRKGSTWSPRTLLPVTFPQWHDKILLKISTWLQLVGKFSFTVRPSRHNPGYQKGITGLKCTKGGATASHLCSIILHHVTGCQSFRLYCQMKVRLII